jgi:hypothetical protein
MSRICSAALVAALLATTGCGASAETPRTTPDASADTARTTPNASAETPNGSRERRRAHPSVAHAHCATGSGNCAAVTGRVLYVEAVDPDGDGDAHYVLVGGHVTAPGLSVIDVERELRPRRLPRAGELVSAAGPVYTGSHGQQQIQAIELHYQRR